ncbi:MAG: TonB-dependent receptor [Gemmatimonadota bacterium]
MIRWQTGWGGAVVVLALGLAAPVEGQSGLITGSVRAEDGPAVSDALVTAVALGTGRERTAVTDSAGFFGIPGLAAGRYRVGVRHLGYEGRDTVVVVGRDAVVHLDWRLRVSVLAVPAIVVRASRRRTRFEELAGATVTELAGADVKRLPGLAESDVLRAVEVLPGVVSTSDFSAAFNVRGGSADENLILLDGFPIYNPFHMGGLFSVFNTDMVRRAELLAGGFPARYGGRVSSVLTVESEPGVAGWQGEGGVSLLASRLAVGGPLPSSLTEPLGLRSARVRVSGRRSYFDQLLRPFFDFPYYLADLQGVAEAYASSATRLLVTGYAGADVLNVRSSADFPLAVKLDWGNRLLGAHWSHRMASGGSVDLRLGHSAFSTSIVFPDIADTRFRSRIGHTLLAADVVAPVAKGLRLGAGGQLARIGYDNLAMSGGTTFGGGQDDGWMSAGYLEARWSTPSRWLVEAGARLDTWAPRTASPMITFSPRLALKRFFASGAAAVKLSAGRYTQFLHSLRDETLPLGIDVWITAGRQAPAVVSDQAQLGLEWFPTETWYAALESYYRTFDGVTANNPADNPNDPTDNLLAGTGVSYGADLLVRREAKDGWSGWLTVSWLRASRTFPDPATAATRLTYPPIFDRRLEVEVVLRRTVGPADVGVRWNFGTGLPYTRPLGSYRVYDYDLMTGRLAAQDTTGGDGGAGVVLGTRNASRYPPYHRLDVSVRRTFSTHWGGVTPYLDVLNIYNRKNVLFYFFDLGAAPPTRSGVSMLPVLPTLGVEVSF